MKEVPRQIPEAQQKKSVPKLGAMVAIAVNVLHGVFVDKKLDLTKTQGYQNILERVKKVDRQLTSWETAQNEKLNVESRRINERLKKAITNFNK